MEYLNKQFLVGFVVLLYIAANTYADFSPPLPEPGTATIDGNYSEWNLTDDLFAEMREAGNPSKDLLSKCYLRYDCQNEVLYVLVLTEPGYEILNSPDDNWVKEYSLPPASHKQVDGNSSDFAWIYDNSKIIGWEASFSISPADYTDFEIHAQIIDPSNSDGRTSSTGKDGKLEVNLNCSALPVELSSFSAKIQNNQLELNWQTATEVNNYGFDIERSLDDVSWSKIGFMEGHGNSNSPKYYTFTDKDMLGSGSYFYRLKQIDIDGQYEYSDVVNISLDFSNIDYQLNQNYPNPFNPTTTISYSIPKETHVNIVVYNIFGEQIARLVDKKQNAGKHSIVFNGSNLASGLYLYSIQTKDFRATRKLLLIK